MSHIFISYSHKDKEYVHKLQVALVERGINAWIDDRIDYGSEWPDEIEKRLQECSAFVLVMTPNAQKSHWVKNEFHNAIELEKPIFSLLLDGEIWWSAKSIQALNVRDGALPPERFFNSLRQAQAAAERNAALADTPKNEINITGDVNGSTIIIGDANKVINHTGLLSADQETHAQQSESTIEESKPTIEENKPTIANSGSPALPRTRNLSGIAAVLSTGVLVTIFAFSILPKAASGATTATNTITPTASITPQLTATVIASMITPTPYPTEITQKDAVMRLIPAGSFTMGSTIKDNEKPPHKVTLPAFYMDQYETSNALYKACVDAKVCTAPGASRSFTHANYYGNSAFDNYPVIYVRWDQAKTYCEWRGARLPSEAEWEYAARGPNGRTYPWGDGIDNDHANYNQNIDDTTAIDSYESGKSPFDLYNMAGNVWEWVNDWYDSNYYQSSPSSNPQGPSNGQSRVLRGGGWSNDDYSLRTAIRGADFPADARDGFGFRCARAP